MIDHHSLNSDQLNSYNVQQLQFALADPKCDSNPFLNDLSPSSVSAALIPSPSDIDYDSRRMSSSAASASDTDSSALSRPEKRPSSPSNSPQPKKSRSSLSVEHSVWDPSAESTTANPTDSVPPPSHADAKVQLPSIFTTFEDSFRSDIRRSSLPNLPANHVRHTPYPPTASRLNYNYTPTTHSSLSAYQFPPLSADLASPDSSVDQKPITRSRLGSDSTFSVSYDQSPYSTAPPLTNGTTPPSTTFPSPNFNSPLHTDYNWSASPSGIVRPSSTPSQLSGVSMKYEDPLRHSSFSAPVSQPGLLLGSGRISGQHDRRASSNAGLKTDWAFSQDFLVPSSNSYPSPSSMTPSSLSVSNSPPRAPPTITSSSLVDRPQRKRGKLPKETTDFLKSWLHRHSDHPYPSEEEKKQLCHATGLSMSQVSNWMINARRRILAPAHRAASGPTTTAPFPPSSRIVSTGSSFLDHSGRRASMPADTLQLYHPPPSMQSHHGYHHHHSASEYISPARNLLSLSTARHHHPQHHHSLSGPGEYGQNRLLYMPGGGPQSAGAAPSPSSTTSMFASPTGTAVSAPPSAHPFSQQNVYPGFASNPRGHSSSQLQQAHDTTQQAYYTNGQSAPGSTPSSGYHTPQ